MMGWLRKNSGRLFGACIAIPALWLMAGWQAIKNVIHPPNRRGLP
jgi:hypothetical protein